MQIHCIHRRHQVLDRFRRRENVNANETLGVQPGHKGPGERDQILIRQNQGEQLPRERAQETQMPRPDPGTGGLLMHSSGALLQWEWA